MKHIDDKAFLAGVRKAFGPLSQQQVDGYNFILQTWETHFWERTSIPQMCVVLATSYHETAHSMQPIAEIGNAAYFTRMYDIRGARPALARQYGNLLPGDGIRYRGHGYVQLTWRVNYEEATKRLRELKLIDDEDFVATPDLVMLPKYAVLILFIGMEEGWFTGRKLDAIIDDKIDGDEHEDFLKSRAIINGHDRDELIAGYAMKYLGVLKAAVKPGAAVAAPAPAKKDVMEVAEATPAGAAAWNRFWTSVAEVFGDHRKV